MAKNNKNAPASAAAAAGTSRSARRAESKAVKNLKTLNAKLVKELEEHQRKIEQLNVQLNVKLEKDLEEQQREMEQLHFQLDSLSAEHDIFHEIEREVCCLVVSAGIQEASLGYNAAAKKAELELKAAEMELLAASTEKEAAQWELRRILDERLEDTSLQSFKKVQPEIKSLKDWIYPIAAWAIVAAAALATVCSCPKPSIIKQPWRQP